ncbi:MAG: hypothetical protein HWN66_12110 [Candidatus Helarchaeota archaeon]|nr:hypothetical protein [Candidatus Helarchaeota archaeon]
MIVERDNKIAEMHKKIHDLNAQITIFKDQIAPALEHTITKLKSQEKKLQDTIEQQKSELQLKDERISASQNILEKAGMGQLLEFEKFQITINKNHQIIKQQIEKIKDLQAQVDQLPIICLRMTNEIKSRESEVHSFKLYNKVLNKKLIEVQKELAQKSGESDDAISELSKNLIEMQDQLQREKEKIANLDREILILNSLIMEKESKINTLEEKVQKFIFE